MATSFVGSDPILQESIRAMYHATADDRGTVQGLAHELDENAQDGKISSFTLAHSDARH